MSHIVTALINHLVSPASSTNAVFDERDDDFLNRVCLKIADR